MHTDGWLTSGAATAAGATLALSLAGGVWASGAHGASPEPGGSHDSAPAYPVNTSGESFGSAADAKVPDEEPDLILVISDQGPEGYVRKSELDPPNFTSPREAIAWQHKIGSAARVLPVFASDGTTAVGTFTIEGLDPANITTR